MEIDEAFNVVAQACSQVAVPLAGHQQIQSALEVLKKKIEENSERPEE